jgi:hypothetical protein
MPWMRGVSRLSPLQIVSVVAVVTIASTITVAAVHADAAPPPQGIGPLDDPAAERRATVITTYDGGEITLGEVEDAIGTASPSNLEDLSSKHTVAHWYQQTLRNELLLAEAKRRGYAEKPDVVRKIKELTMDLMLGQVIADPLKTFVPSDEALQTFYTTRQTELGAPELRRVVQLVVATEAEARELLPRFQAAKGAAQQALIKERSLDQTSKNEGGFSRYFARSGLLDDKSTTVDPEIAKATYALPAVDAVSDVVALGDNRFALLKLLAVRPAYVPTFQQALPVMKKLLTDERREHDRAALDEDMRKRFAPKVHYELLNSLPSELGSGDAP